ncbi:ATP-binding protein [Actinoplanes sp. CA-054009]
MALGDEFHAACAAAAGLAMSLGRPASVLPALRLAASMAPFHEPVQAGLIAALGAAGRRSDALSAYHAVSAVLADELGVEPGPALRAAHLQVLAQPPASPAEMTAGATDDGPAGLVGRAAELAVLRQAVETAVAGGSALAVVEGEPGVGKTRLLREAAAEARRLGPLVVWGSGLEGAGTPSMWLWEQVLRPILDSLPAPLWEEWLASDLGGLLDPRNATAVPEPGAQFRLLEQVVAVVGQASAQRPALLILDDLQWADAASLQLLGHLASRLPAGTAVIGALRDRAPVPGSDLSRVLAAAGRRPDHRRIRLGPLSPAEVAELIRRETGRDPEAEVARGIRARTDGNPFFVQELSRLLNDSADMTPAGVPATVRDVVRGRMSGLDDGARDLLRIAALIGRDVDLALLAGAAGAGVVDCLERLEPLQALGLLETGPESPHSLRFAHDLVRESVAETTTGQQAVRLHLRVADTLERTHADDESVVERLAYHLWAAGPLADPARTAQALTRAGRRAAARLAFAAAVRHLESAAQIARGAGLRELELSALSMLTLVARRHAGYGGSTLELLERAEYLARRLGRDTEAADFLFIRLVGAYTSIDKDRGRWARRLHEQGQASADPIVQAYGRQAWGLYQWDIGEIGEAYRHLSARGRTGANDRASHLGPWKVPNEWAGWLAVITALHGDVEAGRSAIDQAYQGDEDLFAMSVWAYYHTMAASMAGDARWAMWAAERWIAAGADRSGVAQEHYIRLDRLWACAVTGDDPAGRAAEAERLLAATLLDPPRWGIAYHYTLIAEMWLAADRPGEAATALDRADEAIAAHGQRYAEGLLLLMRACLRQARGEPVAVVRAAAEAARARSEERGALLFAHRAERFMAGLDQER